MWPLLTNEPLDGDAVVHRQLRPAGCAVPVDRTDLAAAARGGRSVQFLGRQRYAVDSGHTAVPHRRSVAPNLVAEQHRRHRQDRPDRRTRAR
jgi:hypothetical protein